MIKLRSFLRKQESNLNKNAGFTVSELLMASVVMVLVLAGIIGASRMVQTDMAERNAQVTLHQQARGAMERMVHGVYGTDGIREASSVTIPSSTTIRYTSGIDSTERSFYLSGNEIMYDPDTSTSDNEISIARLVKSSSGLTFSMSDVSGNSIITINLSMEDQVMGDTVTLDLSTQATLRN